MQQTWLSSRVLAEQPCSGSPFHLPFLTGLLASQCPRPQTGTDKGRVETPRQEQGGAEAAAAAAAAPEPQVGLPVLVLLAAASAPQAAARKSGCA